MHKLGVNAMIFKNLSLLSAQAGFLARAAAALAMAAVLVACGGGGTTPVTGVQTLRPLSSDFTTRKAVNYSPFRTFNRDTEVVTKANIKQDMDLLVAGGFGMIRLFDSSDMVARQTLEVIRDNNLNMKVYLGAYLQGYANSKSSANDAEVARAIALANQFSAIVVAVSVGNEMLLFDFNKIDAPATLASYITKVRSAITQPVTTDDNYGWWRTANPVVTNAVDFVSIHTYVEQDTIYAEGLWDWQQVAVPEAQRAAAMMDAAIAAAKQQYAVVRQYLNEVGLSGMPIVIGETGWHAVNTGNAGGNLPFRASAANQKMYYDRLRAWEAAERTSTGPSTIFYFEAFDEPWKLDDNFWGMFTVDRKARCMIQGLNPASASWVYDTSAPCAESSALHFIELAVNPAETATQFTLFADIATAGEAQLPAAQWDAFGNNAGGVTAAYPPVTTTAAPGDAPTSLEITPQPADYGWGLLRHSSTGASSNLSAFSGGTLTAWIKTNGYPGKLQIGISTDTADRKGAEAVLTLSPGDYSYCNTNAWCQVTIPISAFTASNPKIDLRAVLLPFVIRDIYSQTGKAQNTTGLPKIYIDDIYWTK
jgi:exo-beta-1,3-glucanase (GH17 family)